MLTQFNRYQGLNEERYVDKITVTPSPHHNFLYTLQLPSGLQVSSVINQRSVTVHTRLYCGSLKISDIDH